MCDPQACGGMWVGTDADGSMKPVRIPVTLLVVPGMEHYLKAIEAKVADELPK